MATFSRGLPEHKELSLKVVIGVFDALLEKLQLDDEPTFEMTDKAKSNLKYLISIPFQTAFGVPRYKTLSDKVAAIFYYSIKNHLFENGNKRVAIILSLLLLYTNGCWLKMPKDEMYKLAIRVAKSRPSENQAQIERLAVVFRSKMVSLK